MLYLLPVCMLLAVISVGLPSKNEPIQWTGFRNVYYTVKDRIDRLITNWEFFIGEGDGVFSLSLSGYSEDGDLTNKNLVSNHRIALTVDSSRGRSPIYLTGSVNDVYTGESWEKSKEDSLPDEYEYQMDVAELIYGLSRLEPQMLEDYRFAETKSVKIIFNNIRTKTFFYPAKSIRFQFDGIAHDLDMEFAGITFQKAKGSNTSYNLSYYEMNLQGSEFQEMLRGVDDFSYHESRVIDYDRIKLIENEFMVRDRESFLLNKQDFYELYKKRADVIYKRYTQLPDSLPMRVKELAIEITKDEDNNYDKLKAIEAYLLGFEYSYTPGREPKGADFVDFFLFDNKKGYCTSFATAMSVLGRSIGIPTRYVEGYVVDYEDKNEIGYLVRNSNAHAWAEAYFDGVGWIPFEATPSYHDQRYTSWAPKRKKEDSIPTDYYREEVVPPMEVIIEKDYEVVDSEDDKPVILIWVVIILAMIIIFLFILISYYLILRRRYCKDFDKSNYSVKMYMIFIRILALLKYEGYKLGEQETLLMLADKIKDRYKYSDIVFRDLVNIFMGYRYGELPITDEQYTRVSIFYKGLKKQHDNETKALRLHMEELFFLIKRDSQRTNYQD